MDLVDVKFMMLVLLGIGLIMFLIEYGKRSKVCPPPKTIYKYVPRSLEEEQDNPVDVEDIFKTMFNDPSPWVGTFRSNERKKGG